jgi:hypothetical protein
MLDAAVKLQGRKVVRPDASLVHPDDFSGFTACLRQARLHFGF